MERRALVRSLGLVGLSVVASTCSAGPRTRSPQTAAPGPTPPRRPPEPPPAEPAPAPAPPPEPEPDEGSEPPTEEPPEPQPKPDPGTTDGTGPRRIEVICRDALGLTAAGTAAVTHRPTRLTLHHTAVRLSSASLAPEHLRRHQDNHRAQGWSDIAYHYAVDIAGNVYELRHPSIPGDTYTDYDTTGHLQVVCEGNFEVQQPTDALLTAVAGLFAGLSLTHGVAPESLGSHRDFVPTTACPGGGLLARVDDLRAEVTRLHAAGAVGLSHLCGSEGRERVRTIESA